MDRQQLDDVLNRFDCRSTPFSEDDVLSALNGLKTSLGEGAEQHAPELAMERMAFGFAENYKGKAGWDGFYGPMLAYQDDEGRWVQSPSVEAVTKEVLTYWACRAQSAAHPILKARYGGLVWELSKMVPGNREAHLFGRIFIDAAIDTAGKRSHDSEPCVFAKLRFALSISLSLRDTTRMNAVCDALIAYEDMVAHDGLLGLWGISYDALLEGNNVSLPAAQVNKIIGDLEGRLARVTDTTAGSIDPHAAEAAALRLARHYRRLNQPDDVQRVLNLYANAYLAASEEHPSLVAVGWLQAVYHVLLDFGLKDDADKIAVHLREFGKKSQGELRRVSHDIDIPKEEMDKFVEAMTEGSLKRAVTRIAFHFIPKKGEVTRQVKEFSESYIHMSLFGSTIVDTAGRPVAQIGPVQQDLDGHVAQQTGHRLSFSAIFLQLTIDALREKFKPSATDVTDLLYQSEVFVREKRPIVEAGIAAYLAGDYLAAVHLLIPQVEDTLRNLAVSCGGAAYKPGRNGTIMLKNFEDLLRDERVSVSLQEDFVHYLRVLFTDQRGWNLRNNVAHGLTFPASFDRTTADRVFHALLVFGLLRARTTASEETGNGGDGEIGEEGSER